MAEFCRCAAQAANISEAVQAGLVALENDPKLIDPCEDTDVRLDPTLRCTLLLLPAAN